MEKYHAAQFDELISAALQVRLQAYAPYSRYQVIELRCVIFFHAASWICG